MLPRSTPYSMDSAAFSAVNPNSDAKHNPVLVIHIESSIFRPVSNLETSLRILKSVFDNRQINIVTGDNHLTALILKPFRTCLTGRPIHSDTNSTSLGSILDKQQLRAKTIHECMSYAMLKDM